MRGRGAVADDAFTGYAKRNFAAVHGRSRASKAFVKERKGAKGRADKHKAAFFGKGRGGHGGGGKGRR